MTKIYRNTDRITLKVDDLFVKVAPLTLSQKAHVQQVSLDAVRKQDLKLTQDSIVLVLKYAIKGITGLYNSDETPYMLEFDNGVLTDQCAEDLLNLELKDKLTMVCMGLLSGVPSEFTDNQNKALAGVQIIKVESEKKS